jgi:hypothetical protein
VSAQNFRFALFGCFSIFSLIQVATLAHSLLGPRSVRALEGDIELPPAVKAIAKRSCYDCHSNETKWPWYSRLAPMSWVIHRDVQRGRDHLNFSEWISRPGSKNQGTGPLKNEAQEICDAVNDGSMPLKQYTWLHPSARLTKREVDTVCRWAQEAATLP